MLSRYIRSINDLLAQTSNQRTTSEKRTKPLLPKCPLFGGSTVYMYMYMHIKLLYVYMYIGVMFK